MANKLDRYRDKRDSRRTNEPFGPEPTRRIGATQAGRYVVHLHRATRKHYDLRLEIGGVLQSFAVPKGPSLRPLDKHLAIHTEAHPLDYLDFEAVIPEGNYGAGPMIVWDRGTARFLDDSAEAGLEKGKLDFVLHGYKLRGRFALVRLAKKKQSSAEAKDWLLFKKRDAYASDDADILEQEPKSVLSGLRVEELPRAAEVARAIERDAARLGAKRGAPLGKDLTPMRCSDDAGRLADERMLYELKLDGVRILAERSGPTATLRYRTGRNATASYPEIARALTALAAERVILDGEIVTFDERGRPSFSLLSRRIAAQGAADVRAAMLEQPVSFLVFDVLTIGDRDLRSLPLRERKQLLSRIVPERGIIRAVEHVEADAAPLLAFCEQHDLEGIIGKRIDSPYLSTGERTRHWWKHKRARQDDFVIVGYTRGRGSRGALGALELANFVGDALVTRGRVGSGLGGVNLHALQQALPKLRVSKCAAEGELLPAPGGRVFVAPQLVARVEHAGFTRDGRLRHPVFIGLREDVTPDECTAAPEHERERAQPKVLPVKRPRSNRGAAQPNAITNPDKIFWPDENITKRDLCDYYASVADTLLRYLHDRPVLMVRYPDGITGKHFYQWNAPAGTPSYVRTLRLRSDEHSRDVTFLRIESPDALAYVANLGTIPLHILACRFSRLDRCDFITVDFDLGDAPLAHAVTLARTLYELLQELDLPSFPKTSGQTGLHVLIPVGGIAWDGAKALVALLGRILHERHPDISTLERSKKRRPNAVYIDTGQTGRARAIVAPYSVRAHPGATVSTPLRWDEVGPALAPERFQLWSVPDRIAEHGDPMSGLLEVTPDVAAALPKLERMVRLRRGER